MTEEKFVETYCRYCGSQRCSGPGDEMANGCSYYRKIILQHDYFIKEPLWTQEQLSELEKKLKQVLGKYGGQVL